jgi:hypothetical protein
VSITTETVDTGERRSIGGLAARRIITTRTTLAEPGAPTPSSVDVADGWFVDVPGGCGPEGMGEHLMVVNSQPGEPPVQWRIERRSPVERGYPLEMTRRHTSGDFSLTTVTALVEISDAPLDDALFNVPAGFRPALRLPQGGYDPDLPDTLLNRARSFGRRLATWGSRVIGLPRW